MTSRNPSLEPDLVCSFRPCEGDRTAAAIQATVGREATRRLFVAAASWANMCLIRKWVVLQQSPSIYAFWHQADRRPVDYLAGVLACLILAVLFWGALLLSTAGGKQLRIVRTLAEVVLFGAACATVNQLRIVFLGDLVLAWRIAILMPVALVWFLARGRPAIARACITGLVCLSPLVVWNLGSAVGRSLQVSAFTAGSVPTSHNEPPQAAQVAGAEASGSRIVWVIFDEWDFALTFGRRSPGLALPTLDEFRARAFFASAAQAPGDRTLNSLPSLLLGRLVVDARAADGAASTVRLAAGAENIDLQRTPNLVHSLIDRSIRVGVAGWYLPYSRLFGDSLSASYSIPYGPNLPPGGGLAASAATELYRLLPNRARTGLRIGLQGGIDGNEEDSHRVVYDRLVPIAEKYAADPRLGFVLLHLPVPHLPVIYDRSTGQFRTDSAGLTYDDNLALLDRTLNRLKTAMRKTGTWDSSTVLLTSDHWFRFTHHAPGELYNNVPFLLKLNRQNGPVEYQRRFNTVLTGSLFLAIVDGQVRAPDDVGRWLDGHR